MSKRNTLRDLKSRHAVDRRMIRDCKRNYGEFKLIEHLTKNFGLTQKSTIKGVGDVARDSKKTNN